MGEKLNVKKPTTPKPTTPREKLFAGLDIKSRESKESKDKGTKRKTVIVQFRVKNNLFPL